MQLINFIKNQRKISNPVIYEDVLSGRGLVNIYDFIKNLQKYKYSKFTKEIDNSNDKAALISKYKNLDDTCKETFRYFTKYYARCAKNFVLDNMALGGLYIAGGIASKNNDIFSSSDFINEFENSFSRRDVLKNISIYVVTNYDISLIGSCFAAMLHSQKNVKII
jgi:glucokinase